MVGKLVGNLGNGFRSTFRDWVAERTSHPREFAELALAHTVRTAVETAYRRGDQFEKRRQLMSERTRFCAGEPTVKKRVTRQAAVRA